MIQYTYVPEIDVEKLASKRDMRDAVDELRVLYAQRDTPNAYPVSAGFVNAPFDTQAQMAIRSCVFAKQQQPIDVLVVVGIGGSGLGSQAVYQALFHTLKHGSRVVFADTIDPLCIVQAQQVIESTLQADKRVVVVLISKSGNTLETIVYGELILSWFKQQPRLYENNVIVISGDNSPLATWAQRVGCACVAIPRVIEGRFSVFSAVGLVPLALAGVDIEQLCAGAQKAMHDLAQGDMVGHDAVRSACAIFEQYTAGNYLLDFFTFASPLAGLGAWYRQLIGEGLGKTYTVGHSPALVPLVSRGSCDLHSMVQLYLGGRMPSYTQFVTINRWPVDATVPLHTVLPGAERYAGKTISQLMHVLFESTRRAYQKQNKPYAHLALQELTPASVGYFLQMHMLQTILLARLFGVNAFDQPHVELYKKEARALLGE